MLQFKIFEESFRHIRADVNSGFIGVIDDQVTCPLGGEKLKFQDKMRHEMRLEGIIYTLSQSKSPRRRNLIVSKKGLCIHQIAYKNVHPRKNTVVHLSE